MKWSCGRRLPTALPDTPGAPGGLPLGWRLVPSAFGSLHSLATGASPDSAGGTPLEPTFSSVTRLSRPSQPSTHHCLVLQISPRARRCWMIPRSQKAALGSKVLPCYRARTLNLSKDRDSFLNPAVCLLYLYCGLEQQVWKSWASTGPI